MVTLGLSLGEGRVAERLRHVPQAHDAIRSNRGKRLSVIGKRQRIKRRSDRTAGLTFAP
jgi:hypothetical protein